MDVSHAAATGPGHGKGLNERRLWTAAEDLEATFLAEMLKSAGLGATDGPFSGGVGEEQFSSIMVREQAGQIVRAGGIGLAEVFFQSLLETQNGGE